MNIKPVTNEETFAVAMGMGPYGPGGFRDPSFRIASVLLAAAAMGANAKRVAVFLGYPEEEVRQYEKRLRENEIWDGEHTTSNWTNPEDGWFEFHLDIMVAKGILVKKTWLAPTPSAPRTSGASTSLGAGKQ